MLILSRKPGERISIGGGIVVTVIEIRGQKVRLGIDAPRTTQVLRDDMKDRKSELKGSAA